MSKLSLADSWNWYEFQRTLLGEERARVLAATPTSAKTLRNSRYFGMSHVELKGLFDFQSIELGQLAMLGMLACAEGSLRLEFDDRVRAKKKDPISRRFRAVARKRKDRIRLEEDILDQWRQDGTTRIKSAIGEFKGALMLRHWLAHGRYWPAKLGRAAGYIPADVYDICKELLQSFDLMPLDPP